MYYVIPTLKEMILILVASVLLAICGVVVLMRLVAARLKSLTMMDFGNQVMMNFDVCIVIY